MSFVGKLVFHELSSPNGALNGGIPGTDEERPGPVPGLVAVVSPIAEAMKWPIAKVLPAVSLRIAVVLISAALMRGTIAFAHKEDPRVRRVSVVLVISQS